MRKINWIIFRYEIPYILLAIAVYALYFLFIDHWISIDLIAPFVLIVAVIISYRERRWDMEYWIKGTEESSALDALKALDFHEIYRKDNHVLYKKNMRWTTNYYAILSKEDPLIKLKIAEKFEKQVGDYIHNNQLFRPHVVPRRKYKEAVSD